MDYIHRPDPGRQLHHTLDGLDAFGGGKKLQGQPNVDVATVGGVGDDAYYLALGKNVGLIVKKGKVAFKVPVYADVPVDQKKAMEKTLAL